MRMLLVSVVAVSVLVLATAGPGLADPSLPNIPAHRHFVQAPDGTLIEVGPRLCDDPTLQSAFNQFHVNVHVHVAGTVGPAVSAPGLHNSVGAELVARPCTFVP